MLCCRTGFGRIINGWLFEGRENIERYFHLSTHLRPIRQEDNVLWGQILDADKKRKECPIYVLVLFQTHAHAHTTRIHTRDEQKKGNSKTHNFIWRAIVTLPITVFLYLSMACINAWVCITYF